MKINHCLPWPWQDLGLPAEIRRFPFLSWPRACEGHHCRGFPLPLYCSSMDCNRMQRTPPPPPSGRDRSVAGCESQGQRRTSL